MAERTRVDDLSELVQVATRAIAKALNDGDEKYPPGSWMKETVAHQKIHMEAHLSTLTSAPLKASAMSTGSGFSSPGSLSEDHLAHLICRAAIMYALEKKNGWR